MKFFTCLAAKNNDRNINMLQNRGFLRKAKYNGSNFALGRCTGALPSDFWGNFMSVFKGECIPHTWHIKCTSLSRCYFYSFFSPVYKCLCAFLFAQRRIITILKLACVPYKDCASLKGFPASLRRRKTILSALSGDECSEKLGWFLGIQENQIPLPSHRQTPTGLLVNGQNLGASGVREKVQRASRWGKRRSNLIV